MLPQEKFAHKYLYEGNFLGIIPVSKDKDIESLMNDCHLKFKNGKSVRDLREAFWGFGSTSKNNIDLHVEWALERADQVFTINWETFLKSI